MSRAETCSSWRFAGGEQTILEKLAAELAEAKVDVIVVGSVSAATAAANATNAIPIVMATAADPVAAGLVESLARPGGNVTGLSLETAALVAKRLQLLKEAVPGLRRVAAFYPADFGANLGGFRVVDVWLLESERAADAMGMRLEMLVLGLAPEQWDEAFKNAKSQGIEAITVLEAPQYLAQRAWLAEAALRHRLPSMLPFAEQAEAGALMAYGAATQDLWRRAAVYVDKILKGAKPADLPVQQPLKFELVLNLATAKALGITIPKSILLRADRVIE